MNIKQLLFALIILFWSCPNVYGQSLRQLEDSINIYHLKKPLAAIPFLEEAIPFYKRNKDWNNYVQIYYKIATNYFYLNDFENIGKYLDLSVAAAKKNLPPNHALFGDIWNAYGYYTYTKGNFPLALEYFQQALVITSTQKKKTPKLLAEQRINIAGIFDEQGDHQQAIAYYKEALSKIGLTLNDKTKSLFITLYNNTGRSFYKLKKYASADSYFQKALKLLATVDPKIHRYNNNFQQLYNNIALNAQLQGQYETTFTFLQKRLELPHASPKDIGTAYKHIGTTFFKQKKYQEALDTLQAALVIREKVYPKKHSYRSLVHRAIGDVQTAQQNYTAALNSYQNALCAIVYNFEEEDINQNPSIENALDYAELLQVLTAKANALQLAKKYKHALATYQLCSQVIDLMRTSFQHNTSKLFLMEEGMAMYEKAIALALQLNDKKTAYHLVEKSKAMLLLEAMRGIKARSNLPKALLDEEQALKVDISYYQKKIWAEEEKGLTANSEAIKKWGTRVFKLKEEYIKLKDRFAQEYPSYYQLQYNTSVTSIDEIQRELLNKKTGLVSYFIGTKKTYVFAISNNDIQVHTIEKTTDLIRLVNTLRQCLRRDKGLANPHLTYYETAHQLYQTYLGKAISSFASTVDELIIIPDGVLNYVPFETLLTELPTFNSPRYELRKISYLIRDYQLTYGYSATLLLEGRKLKNNKDLKTFGGFVPNFGNTETTVRGCDGDVLGNLPFGKENIVTINDIVNGTLHFDEEASLGHFKKIANQYKILHLCTHACAETDFKNTRIYFSDDELLAFELYNIPLNAELAVLSACETGLGKLQKGEGIMSLARAFMSSGCPSVVTSLWSVDDKSTSEIMRYFYQNLKKGHAKDEALHHAKLQYLEEKGVEASHPYYWSGFVHIGNTAVLFPTFWQIYQWWIIGGSVFLLLAGAWFFRRKGA